MSLVKKVFRNASYLLIARTTFRVLTAVVIIYAARYLGVERYGMFETAAAWANAFLAINDIGMSTLIVREAARDEKKMAIYFGNTLLVELVLSVVLFGVIMLIGIGLEYNHTTLVLMALMGIAGLIYEFRKVMRGIFRVMLRLKAVAVLEVLNGALYLLLALWIFASISDKDLGVVALAHANLWTNALMVIALFVYTLTFVKPQVRLKQVWPMIKQSYVFTLYNIFFMLYFQIDQIILSIMKDSTAVGIYSAPAKLVTVLLFVPIMIFQVTMPIMYRLSTGDLQKYKRINNATWRYLAAFGVPAGVGMWVLAPEIIGFVYDESYIAAVPILSIMGWFFAVRMLGITQGNSLTTTDRQGLRAFIQILTVILNIILDIFLIRRYGTVGAAAATLITECVIASSYLYFSSRYLKESLSRNLLQLLPVGCATAIMTGALFLIKTRVHVIVALIFGAIIYLTALWIFRFFKSYDRQMITEIMKKKTA